MPVPDRLDDLVAVMDPNVVNARALMFSRQTIPYPRGDHSGYLRQLGLYGMTDHRGPADLSPLPPALSNAPNPSRRSACSNTAIASTWC
jgi:hypothetical protein